MSPHWEIDVTAVMDAVALYTLHCTLNLRLFFDILLAPKHNFQHLESQMANKNGIYFSTVSSKFQPNTTKIYHGMGRVYMEQPCVFRDLQETWLQSYDD